MAKDPNKFWFNDKTGTGWKRDTNIESPTYGKWVQFKLEDMTEPVDAVSVIYRLRAIK